MVDLQPIPLAGVEVNEKAGGRGTDLRCLAPQLLNVCLLA